jgi:WD repeat and SOF domain-containing protein 1
MVKVKAICRDENDYKRKTNTEIEKVYRNTNPNLHPLNKAREYVRALNAVKLEKVFAKPFLFSLNEHTDGIKCLAKNRTNLSEIISGSFDGQVILWNIPEKKPLFNINTSHNFVKGLCYSNTGEDFLSCGDDNAINLWNKRDLYVQKGKKGDNENYKPKNVYTIDGFIDSIDHCYSEPQFATGGGVVAIWNYERNTPVQEYKNSVDGFIRVKYNYVENNILLATGYDRSISIYDLRTNNPLKSVFMKNKSSAACWNPQEPFNFTIGNEDSNCYTYDMRNLDKVKMIHKDHILAM